MIDIGPIIILVILFVVLRGVFRLLTGYSAAEHKGKVGEKKVSKKIDSFCSKNNQYKSLHDITLPTPDGTTQIDHVLISIYGIFVIETKNMSGWIFGSERQNTWTQTFRTSKHKFQNPLRQNYKHVKTIQNILAIKSNKIKSVVVFAGNCVFKTDMPENVLVLRELRPFINAHSDPILSSDEVEKYYQKLMDLNEKQSLSGVNHIDTLKSNQVNPVCPRCGKAMTVRSKKKGANSGSQFWGCTGYPACRATKSIS